MMLAKTPKVQHTSILRVIGKPEDFGKMVMRSAMENKRLVDVRIPGQGPAPKSDEKFVKANSKPDVEVTPLKDLTREMTKWMVKVRLAKKHDLKSCKGGEGRMQRIDLIDAESTEISAMLFDDAIASTGESLVEGKVYYIIDGKVRVWKGQNKGAGSELTIFFDKRTKVRPAEDDKTIPFSVYHFVEFDDIHKYKGCNIDVIGRASVFGDGKKQKANKTESEPEKRDIILTNDKGQQINVV